MFEGEEDGVTEPDPAQEPHGDETVTGRGLVQVQHVTRVKELQEVWGTGIIITLPELHLMKGYNLSFTVKLW